MKHYEKRRQKPESAAAKESKVKGPLLQTYFTSLMSLVLCVGMFFGTSYAWFTSEVNNTANEIYIGTLDVGLYKEGATGWEDLSQPEVKLLNKDIRWEPGYTNLETIQVRNEGDLAFKYVLRFTDGSVVENGTQSTDVETQGQETAAQSASDLNEIAENFVVWVYKHSTESPYQKPANYKAICEEGSGWVQIGTLDKVLAGEVVLSGTMEKQPAASQSEATAANGTAAEEETGDTYTIALHMRESAGADVMKHTISLNVKLVAYQQTSEEDSFDNQYDAALYVTNEKELKEALATATGETVIRFGNDITGKVDVVQKPGVKITIDGDGHKYTGDITVNGQSARYDSASLTIKKIHFVGGENRYDACINLGHKDNINDTRYTNNVTVQNCIFEGQEDKVVAIASYTGGDWNLAIIDCEVKAGIHSLAQLHNVETGLKITNCKVYSKNGINLNSTPGLEMIGCSFDVKGYAVRFGQSSGTPNESMNFVLTNNVLKTSASANSGDAVIIFRGDAVKATLELKNTTLEGAVEFKGSETAKIIKN